MGSPLSEAEAESLYHDHAQEVFAAAYRVTLDAAAAEDATHSAFVRLLTKPPRHHNTVGWLKRVAVNAAIDGLRKHGRKTQLRDEHLAAIAAPQSAKDVDLRAIYQEIAALVPAYRAAVLAVDQNGLSYQEASKLLNISLSKLKSDLYRGRQQLQQRLSDIGLHPSKPDGQE